MRKLMVFFTLIFMGAVAAYAQNHTSDASPSWQSVEGLAPNTPIQVRAFKASGKNCSFRSASETELICSSGNGTASVFPRADVKAVKVQHRARSAAAGMAIGAGVGAAAGAPIGRSGSFVGHGVAAAIVAIPGALIGLVVGVSTDFTHSTIYKAH